MAITKAEEEIIVAISAGVLAVLRDIVAEGDYTLHCDFYKGTGPSGTELFLKNISLERKQKLD